MWELEKAGHLALWTVTAVLWGTIHM